MDTMFFASDSYENLVIARSCKRWAVSPGCGDDASRNKIKGNSVNLHVGDLIFFWITAKCKFYPSVITMPAIVMAAPDPAVSFKNVTWDGEWQCPFQFQPLGRPDRHVSKEKYYEVIPSPHKNIATDLHLGMPFNRVSHLSNDAIEYLIAELVDDNITYGLVREIMKGGGFKNRIRKALEQVEV